MGKKKEKKLNLELKWEYEIRRVERKRERAATIEENGRIEENKREENQKKNFERENEEKIGILLCVLGEEKWRIKM